MLDWLRHRLGRLAAGAGRGRLVAVLVATLVVGASPTTPAQPGPPDSISDQETIFVELRASGEVRRVISVDWLRVSAQGRVRVVDRAPGDDSKPLAGTPPARRSDGDLVWEVDVDGTADLFTTASPKAALPLEARFTYLLDGRAVDPDRAQGSSGRVRVQGVLRNITQPFVPLVVSVSFALPVASFRSLDKGSGTAVAVGRSLRLSYVITPRPEGTFFFEVETRRAQLPRFTVTVFPQTLEEAPFLVALGNLRDMIEELRAGGLGDLGAGAAALGGGAALGGAGARRLQGALAPPDLRSLEQQAVRHLPHSTRSAILALSRQTRRSAEAKTKELAAALARGVDEVKREAQKLQPPAEVRRLVPGSGSLDLEGALRSLGLGRVAQAGSGIGQLIAGLAQIQASAAQLEAALARLDREGFERVLSELETSQTGLPTEEELARAQAFDTFTGKPEGATGQVRFVYQVDAPVRAVQAPSGPVASPDPRPFWRRIIGLLPGIG